MNSQSISWGDVGEFLWPTTHGGFQLTFIIAIISCAVVAFVWALRSANETSWSGHWQGGLSRDHGSLHDLSDAVASPAERVCTVLPGILLVIGLLGTFIGLGIALNSASRVLDVGNAGGIDSDIGRVINGIGLKFTTSTWGLIAFLSLRFAIAIAGWDDRRLRWCVQRISLDAAEQRRQDLARESDLQSQLRAELRNSGQENSLRVAMEVSRLNDAALPVLRQIESHEKRAEHTLSEFVRTNVESMKSLSSSASQMQAASLTMSEAAKIVGLSATALSKVIETFGTDVSKTLDGLKSDLIEVIQNVDVSFNKNLHEMSAEMAASSQVIASTMQSLGQVVGKAMADVGDVIEQMKATITQSVEIQATSLFDFKTAAQELSENAMHMQTPIKELERLLNGKLATIADIGLEMTSLNKRTVRSAEVADKINESLKQIADRLDVIEWLSVSDLNDLKGAIEASTRGFKAAFDAAEQRELRAASAAPTPVADAAEPQQARAVRVVAKRKLKS